MCTVSISLTREETSLKSLTTVLDVAGSQPRIGRCLKGFRGFTSFAPSSRKLFILKNALRASSFCGAGLPDKLP